MAGGHKPRSGSIAYYPRVRAKKQNASFSTYPVIDAENAKPITFFGYKAGMLQVFGKNANEKSPGFGQETSIPATVLECPPIKIIGTRVYGKATYGIKVLGEATIEKPEKNLRKTLKAFKKKGKKAKEKEAKGNTHYTTFEDLEKLKEKVLKVTLLAEMQPSATGIGKKKADLSEINLQGSIENQFAFAKEKVGKEIRVADVFEALNLIDVKAVTKGRGIEGPVKRFGVKIHRPKAKKHRIVGSISPWHPATVMWTVARPGQMGYHTRTEFNKKILFIDNNNAINPKSGFLNYGTVRSDYVIVIGSLPGPAKRLVALRPAIRSYAKKERFTDLKLPIATEEVAQ